MTHLCDLSRTTINDMADKCLERRYLDRALGLLHLTPEGPIASSETPDFLVPLDRRILGIEVTAFYLPEPDADQPHQARVGMRQVAVEQARRLYRSNGGSPLYVTVHFAQDRSLSKRGAYELGPLLARAIQATPVPPSIEEGAVHVPLELLPPEVASISIAASVDASDELWYAGISGWVAPIERSHIDREIARKAKRLAAIRQKCSVNWLLIVNDGFRGGAFCKLSADALSLRFISPFDRTLWLDSARVYDLGDSTGSG